MRRSSLILILAIGLVSGACAGAAAPIGQFVDQSAGGGAVGDEGGEARSVSGDGTDTTGGAPYAPRDASQIIRTGSLALQVSDIQAAVAAGRASIEGLGGYIGASRESNHDDQPTAQITYRVPVDRWDDALAVLRSQADKVVEEVTDSLEVTDQLVDLAARVRNLRASEEALLAIAAKAEKITDVLEVQKRLTEVRGEIEQIEAQRVSLEDQVAYATLTVTYGLDVAAVSEAVKRFDPSDEVDRASAQLIDVFQSLATAGIWFAIVWLPVLLILLVIAFIVIRVSRRLGIRVPRANRSTGWGKQPQPPAPPTAPSD